MADPNRDDQYPLPPVGYFWEFKPSEGEKLFICRDGTCTASNAAMEVWSENDIISTVCFIHAAPFGFQSLITRLFFNNVDNIEVFQEDLNTYKLTPFIHMIDYMHEAGYDKQVGGSASVGATCCRKVGGLMGWPENYYGGSK